MATIGLDDLYYATITEGNNGDETYGTPVKLAKAISADLSLELAEAILYADDAAKEARDGRIIKMKLVGQDRKEPQIGILID